jgi:hypothetical protein
MSDTPSREERCATLCPVCGLKYGHDRDIHAMEPVPERRIDLKFHARALQLLEARDE